MRANRIAISLAVALPGISGLAAPAAAEDALLNTSVGICETALRQGNPDVRDLAETFGFTSTKMPNGGPAWQHQAGADRTVITSSAGICAIILFRGNYTSGATEAFQSWARASEISFSAVPNGDKYAEKGSFTYRYREFPQNGSGAVLISQRQGN